MKYRSPMTLVRRLLLLAGLWWLLTGGDGGSWLFGGPAILALTIWRLGDRNVPKGQLHVWRLLHFVPWFVWRSLVGSCDVAWRALHWRLPIAPVVWVYPFRLPADRAARVFFANCISLLPGTLTAEWEEDALRVHVLTESPHATAELQALERQVGFLFGHSVAGY